MRSVGLRDGFAQRMGAGVLAAALALSLGAALGQTQTAWAETGSFEISSTVEDPGAVIQPYMLFKADIDGSSNVASNVQWGSDDYKKVIMDFIAKDKSVTGASADYGAWLFAEEYVSRDLTGVNPAYMAPDDLAAYQDPENALAYISLQIQGSKGLTMANGKIATGSGTFSNNLADEIVSYQPTLTSITTETTKLGTPASFTLDEGFYLFYNQDSAPMWVPVGGTDKSGQLKDVEILPIRKEVYDEDAGVWGKVADESVGNKVQFRLTGGVSAKKDTSGYKYEFRDTIPAGLLVDSATVKVYAVDSTNARTEITSSFTVSGTSPLVVTCGALFNSSSANYSAISSAVSIVCEYEATVSASATKGVGPTIGALNTNSFVLVYGVTGGELTTTPESANVATWELDIIKVDADAPTKKLQGAVFAITAPLPDGGTGYVQSDGSISSAYNTFTTDSDGKIAVERIDAGKYGLQEITPPTGYEMPKVNNATLDITSNKDQDTGMVTSLVVVVNNGADTTADADSGIITVTIPNDASVVLPITGMTPSQLGTIVGVLLVAAGVVFLIVRSRRGKREAQA